MSANGWKIPQAVRRTLIDRAQRDYPDETCGFIFGAGDALHVVPMKNIQNRLHREDPGRHPRDADTAYAFDPEAMYRVMSEKKAAGIPLRAIYHSHPDHDAYFSDEDSAFAAPFGEPSYPGVVYLVCSVRKGKAVDLKAFDWSEEAGRFVEVPVEVSNG